MASILRPKLNKIPGFTPVLKQDNAVKDLTKLTRLELLDMKERQAKLLSNKTSLNRLPDKGKRINDLHEKVLAELERRLNIDEAANMFSKLNIAAKGQEVLNHLEWSGRLDAVDMANIDDTIRDVLDSDDEVELDPLRIIAQRTMHERRTQVLPPEPKLITADDLAEIELFKADSPDSGLSTEATSNSNSNDSREVVTPYDAIVDADLVDIVVAERLSQLKPKLQHIIEKPDSLQTNSIASIGNDNKTAMQDVEQHVRYLVEKTELRPTTQREKYKPYKTTLSNVHAPEKECLRKQGKHWEVTAATPAPIQHNGTMMLSLLDSVEIQANYLAKMKELQENQAAERLAARMKRLGDTKMQLPTDALLKANSSFTEYRTSSNHIEGNQRFNEDDEVHDLVDEERSGGVVTYVVYN